MLFGFEYFSGANVVVEIKGVPALECAGLSYEVSESKRPVYGYSSRFFDGVARGQVLVQGTILLNYVHEDYFQQVLKTTVLNETDYTYPEAVSTASLDIKDEYGRPLQNKDVAKEVATRWYSESNVAAQLKYYYWNQDIPNKEQWSPHDLFGGFNIRITFGEKDILTGTGRTGVLLEDVYIVGRGKQIQISEDVIVESFPFIARNTSAVYPPVRTMVQVPTTDPENDTRVVETTAPTKRK